MKKKNQRIQIQAIKKQDTPNIPNLPRPQGLPEEIQFTSPMVDLVQLRKASGFNLPAGANPQRWYGNYSRPQKKKEEMKKKKKMMMMT